MNPIVPSVSVPGCLVQHQLHYGPPAPRPAPPERSRPQRPEIRPAPRGETRAIS